MSGGAIALPGMRPIAWREYLLLAGGLLLAAGPHGLRAPWWLIGLTLFLYAWRGLAVGNPRLLPARWMLVVIVALGMAGIWLQYRALFGRTPGMMLLVLFSGLKLLESRHQRDAAAVVFLIWFLAITNFLHTQDIEAVFFLAQSESQKLVAGAFFTALQAGLCLCGVGHGLKSSCAR